MTGPPKKAPERMAKVRARAALVGHKFAWPVARITRPRSGSTISDK
ncbi:MAG: hypothetical protein QXJ32_02020 [Thermoplasmata archaeon]